MRLQFVGAATTVTGSQFLLRTERANVVVDCGMFQGSPSEVARNNVPFPYDPKRVDALLVTHAHLDHCGLIPLLVKGGFHGPIYLTAASAELVRIVLLDSAKVQVEQARERRRAARRQRGDRRASDSHAVASRATVGAESDAVAAETRAAAPAVTAREQRRADRRGDEDRRGRGYAWPPPDFSEETGFDPEAALRRQPPELETSLYQPLYATEDVEEAVELFRPIEYDERVEVADGVRAIFRDAGHILGSAMISLDASDGEEEPKRIVFSGDLGRPHTPIIRDPTVISDGADFVVVESTYGGREHEPGEEAIRMLAEIVKAVGSGPNVLLIPSFAIGRTQEVVWHLDRLLDAGRIPHVPLYLDSPMASRASDVYRRYPGYYDDQTHRLLVAGESPLDYPGQRVTNTATQSRAILEQPRPVMIVSSNGMLTGGRVVEHLRDLIEDPSMTLLFVGYQGEGTLGAHLQAGAREVKIDGRPYQVRCQIRSISGFSAHADETELLDWLRAFTKSQRKPRRVFLVHGDPAAREVLAPRVAQLALQPYLPSWREEVELT